MGKRRTYRITLTDRVQIFYKDDTRDPYKFSGLSEIFHYKLFDGKSYPIENSSTLMFYI